MLHDSAKAWPHPVLHPHGDDYPDAEFEVDIDLRATKDGAMVRVEAVYRLSEQELLRLISREYAAYCLLVKATSTQYRRAFVGSSRQIEETFELGALAGRVRLSAYVVSTRELADFRADGWHSDFGTKTYVIPAGTVLAEDVPKEYWIDTADDRSLGSIIGHRAGRNVVEGYWRVEIDEKRIWIVMSHSDTDRYRELRDRVGQSSDGQYLMNGLYLPALVEALHRVDQGTEDYQEYRWFASLERRLEDVGGQVLGAKDADRVADAQKILEGPMLRMPFFERD